LSGALIIPHRIRKVGHVRMFAALASIASISILFHSIHVSFLGWFLMRFISGMCFVGMYTVAESWINDLSENENRGQALSVYMMVSMAGSALGQLFLNIADPETASLFMLVSILISISLVPILVVVSKQPDFSIIEFLSIKELYKASPLGVVAAVLTGLAHGALWGIGTIYGITSGLTVQQVSIFMFTFIIGGTTTH
jgi:MFS family permease